ncbi:hypothetical protein EDC44_101158 [Cricetibacter osteomyelitidis]|uniref:Recombinase RecA n=1 Tax=Cricetibacter osteomyelitidis TaxID=1521931 RepID=A0A4R2TA73_9PAST|nr:recombinase RecA [Cricetibacter osteomyelitidis]TCP97774.1 hypothetical protein EDC44_101158 [Cricetibacter osteomyelitidis]
MSFSETQRKSLLAQKGIGETVIKRLQEMGFDSVEKLAEANADFILQLGADITGSTCWRNSPQARKAIETAITWAKTQSENK